MKKKIKINFTKEEFDLLIQGLLDARSHQSTLAAQQDEDEALSHRLRNHDYLNLTAAIMKQEEKQGKI
jgi:hypothetical protein